MIIKYIIFVIFGINVILGEDDRYQVSQISPKSVVSSFSTEEIILSSSRILNVDNNPTETEESNLKRVERSALLTPDLATKNSLGEFNELDSAGRYFNSINPTKSESSEKVDMTESYHNENSFFGQRGRRAKSSRPLDNLSFVNQTKMTANTYNHTVRQNSSPDIQDIITGIVKLLNGNVNVHADVQNGNKRPIHTRINNRGPPRISEAQVPIDFEQPPKQQTTSSHMIPPEGPIRPFLNGVPLPEQLVPSMQQNYRPNFVSQNRPPWQRPRPKPPLNVRRPIPSYKPILPISEYVAENEQPIENDPYININQSDNTPDLSEESEEVIDNVKPDNETSEEENSTEIETNPNSAENAEKVEPTEVITTIIQSVSEVNTVGFTESSDVLETSVPTKVEHLDSSMVESMVPIETISSQTPTLDLESIPTPSTISESTTQSIITEVSSSTTEQLIPTSVNLQPTPSSYHPRPGMVFDDPEFKPGSQQKPQPNRPIVHRPPGYGEIFDITLSAIQGPNGGGTKQTVNIKPYSHYDETDIIIASSTEGQEYVSIDGKRTYINLFGESVPAPMTSSNSYIATKQIMPTQTIQPGVTGSGYVVAETEPPVSKYNQRPQIHRVRPFSHDPPVRIDTCIVGDDSTCDQNQNEKCKIENGVSSCHCRPSYSRRKHREPCRKVVSLVVSLRIDRIHSQRISWDKKLAEQSSEPYHQLSFEAIKAINSAMSMTPFSDEFIEAKVNNFHQGYNKESSQDIFVNMTIMIDENNETLRPSLKTDIQHHLLGVIHRRNNNIGNSALYVESPPGSVSNIKDLNECSSPELNDCHPHAICSNTWGGFHCDCMAGYRDPWADNVQRSGRECSSCSESNCNNRGTCSYDDNGSQVCKCIGNYYGSTCEIDGDVITVAIGASVCALIIIILTLVCLIMWSRKWQREHKNTMIGSPVFGYMNTQMKTPIVAHSPYQVTLEDRMRWAQIADVIQANPNHYAAEPVPPRPNSNIFAGFPHIQQMHQVGTLPMTNHLSQPHNRGTLPPVPLPRLGLNRTQGMRALENSSSSDDDDRAELTEKNFHVPRPKSTASLSLTNQSGIYYDLDYDRAGDHLYGMTNNYNTTRSENKTDKYKTVNSSKNPIPMTTYSSGRAPSTTYYN